MFNGKGSQIKDFLKSKFQQNNKNKKSNENFIIKHNANNKNLIKTAELLDQRRIVFVSIYGLYRTWKHVPSVQLHSAIILLPLQKRWLYDPIKYNKEICDFMNVFEDMAEDTIFVDFLKWKDFQGCIFWMLDDFTYPVKHCKGKPVSTEFTAPFWLHFSAQLVTLYNPLTRDTYKSLQVDENWWRQLNKSSLKFSDSILLILQELFFLTMKYKQIQEIIYQSYPKSLNPITAFDENVNSINCDSENTHFKDSLTQSIETNVDWHIFDHYNPYDLNS
eukprot:488997_1